jgi:hypothetical protein
MAPLPFQQIGLQRQLRADTFCMVMLVIQHQAHNQPMVGVKAMVLVPIRREPWGRILPSSSNQKPFRWGAILRRPDSFGVGRVKITSSGFWLGSELARGVRIAPWG